MELSAIRERELPDSLFAAPTGYRKVSLDELSELVRDRDNALRVALEAHHVEDRPEDLAVADAAALDVLGSEGLVAVERPAGVENLVSAMFRVGLREHHQLGVGGVPAHGAERADQVVDFV